MPISSTHTAQLRFIDNIYKPKIQKLQFPLPNLNNGTKLLNQELECDTYIAKYGGHHFHKLYTAFSSTNFQYIEKNMKNKMYTNAIQGDLFSGFSVPDETTGISGKEIISMPEADVTFYRHFFNTQESDELFQILFNEIKWRQDSMNIYGKEVNLPRKTAWYGDKDKSYTFSGIHLEPEPWTFTLLRIKEKIEEIAKVKFNSVLLNLYRDGNDGISWHTDAEPELGNNPIIASVSFGGVRRFMFRHKDNKDLKTEIELTHGSCLFMAGSTQHFWQHQIPKTSKKVQPRINLTFRVINHSF